MRCFSPTATTLATLVIVSLVCLGSCTKNEYISGTTVIHDTTVINQTVHDTVVFSPEKLGSSTPTSVTTRFAGSSTATVATVRVLFVSFDSVTYAVTTFVSVATVT